MPYRSRAQMRYLWATKPKLAKEFGKNQSTKAIRALPDHVKAKKAKAKSGRSRSRKK